MSTLTLTDFLLARIAEDEAPTFALHPYRCEPGCCAPAGWVGHECLICQEPVSYGGTVAAITESAQDHAERVHRRSRVLAECKAKRQIVDWAAPVVSEVRHENEDGRDLLCILALPYADHADYRQEWRT